MKEISILSTLAGIVALCIVGSLVFTTIQSGPPQAQACTMEAKICPDGTAVRRTGPHCEFAACPLSDMLSKYEGVITAGNPGLPQGELILVYERPGAPALHKLLTFDANSLCGTGEAVIACMAMSVSFDTAFVGKRVSVSGFDRGADIVVRRFEILTAAAPQKAAVSAQVGETVSALGVSITPLEVNDSRCPQDVQCIWAGMVTVKVRISSGLGESTAKLEVGGSITTEAEIITLTDVEPAVRNAGVEIPQSDYLLFFKIAKRTGI